MAHKLNYLSNQPLGEIEPNPRQAQFGVVSFVTGILVNIGWCAYAFFSERDNPSERFQFLALLLCALSVALGIPLAIAALCAKPRRPRRLILPLVALLLNSAWIVLGLVGLGMLLNHD